MGNIAKKGRTRNMGSQTFEHGSKSPDAMGKFQGNQIVPDLKHVPLVPSDKGDFDQHHGNAGSDGE